LVVVLVDRVYRYAMSFDSGTGVELLESEGFGGGGPNDVPEVDAEFVAEPGHLVDQRDVDVPVCILEQLGGLGFTRALGADDGFDEPAIEGLGAVGACGGDPADDLRGVAGAESGIAWEIGRAACRERG